MSRRPHHRVSGAGSETPATSAPEPHRYRAALIGCGRMGAFIDNGGASPHAFSHAAGYLACPRTVLVALSDPRAEVMNRAGERYGVAAAHRYRDYREMLEREQPDIVSVATQPEQRAAIVIHACEHGARAIYAEKPLAAFPGAGGCDGGGGGAPRGGVQHGDQPALGNAVRHHEEADPRRPLRQAAVDDHPPGGRLVQHGQPRVRPVLVAERRPAGGVGAVPPDQRRRRSRQRPAAARSEGWGPAAVRQRRGGVRHRQRTRLRGGGGVRAGGDQLARRGQRVPAARGRRGEPPRPPGAAPGHLSALHPQQTRASRRAAGCASRAPTWN